MKSSKNEILVSAKYTRRDMEQLAVAIGRDWAVSKNKSHNELERSKQLTNIIRDRFTEFR